jgi:ankyrin repeat protein
LLVEKGADLDIPNANGMTPVELAVQEAHANCVQYLQSEIGNQYNCNLVTYPEYSVT